MRSSWVFGRQATRVSLPVVAITAAILMLSCSSSKPPAEASPAGSTSLSTPAPLPHLEVKPTDKILGWVDVLKATPTSLESSGQILASGWAASCVAGAPITSVTLLVDGKPIRETKTFTSRPDVAAAYSRSDFEQSGWKIEIPIKKLPPGKHPVTIRAVNGVNDVLIIPGVTLTIE